MTAHSPSPPQVTAEQIANINELVSPQVLAHSVALKLQWGTATTEEKAAVILTSVAAVAGLVDVVFPGRFMKYKYTLQWLSEHKSVCQVALRCHEQQDFTGLLSDPDLYPNRYEPPIRSTIGDNPILKKTKITLHHADAVIAGEVEMALHKLRPLLLAVIRGKKKMDIWNPDSQLPYSAHMRKLEIPLIDDNPSLLVHDLGKLSQCDINLNPIFNHGSNRIRICYDSRGRGKTRTILEGLCRNYGLYFVCIVSVGIGSTDLPEAIGRLIKSGRWTETPKVEDGVCHDAAMRRNEELASRRFQQILLARLTIFKLYLELIRPPKVSESDSDHHPLLEDDGRRFWTLLQVAPALLMGRDAFSDLAKQLRHASPSYLTSHIASLGLWISENLPQHHKRLFYVVDEAQRAATLHPLYQEALPSEGRKQSRALLRQIVEVLGDNQDALPTLIISGTSLAEIAIRDAVCSGFGKPSPSLNVIHQKGDFSKADMQKEYIAKYVPAEVIESPSGQRLLKRAHMWLRGRYRFTVAFVQALLKDHFQRPHHVLNAYVHFMTTYTPVDCLSVHLLQEPDGSIEISGVVTKTFEFDSFRGLPNEHPVIQHIYKVVFGFLMDEPVDNSPSWSVETAFARVLTGGFAQIEENLAFLALARWLEMERHQDFTDYLAARLENKNDRAFAFETTIPLYLSIVFDGDTPLNQIFNFFGTAPDWASEGATLVGYNRGTTDVDDVFTDIHYSRDPNAISHVKFARRATSHRDTVAWFDNPDGIAFLFPDKGSGPDCFALARLKNGRYVWIAMQMKNHSREVLADSVLRKAIRTVTPSHLCHSLRGSNETSRETILANMARMAHCDDKHPLQVLRVVAAYPGQAYIDYDPFPQIENGVERHPLATLNIDRLLQYDPSNYLHTLVACDVEVKVQKRRMDEEGEDQGENEGEDEEECGENECTTESWDWDKSYAAPSPVRRQVSGLQRRESSTRQHIKRMRRD